MSTDGWLRLDLRHLAALEAVGRNGSFGAAAVELGYTQSAVSQQIAQLERIVGERLVERPGGPRRVSLTEAGELLLRHADAIVAQIEAARADLAALGEGGGVLRIGIYQSAGARLLPPLLRRFADAWPNVEIQLQEREDNELLRLVERGELDVAFTTLPIPPGPFTAVELLRDEYVLLVAADSPLAERDDAPSRRDLADIPLVAWRSTRDAEEHLRGIAPNLNVLLRTDDNGTLVGLVAEGLGAAIVPRLVANPANPAVVALPFGRRIPPRIIGLAWHRDRWRSEAAKAFVAEAQAFAAEFSSRGSPARSGRPSA
jgi:molybdate transport repressor ModE-like protein